MRKSKLFVGLAGVALLGSSVAQADMVTHWRLDETSGIVAADTASAGSVANDASWVNTGGLDLVWTNGIVGGATYFPGGSRGDTHFRVDGIEMDGAQQMSYSVWVKPDLSQDSTFPGVFTASTTARRVTSGGVTNNYTGQYWGTAWVPNGGGYRARVDNTGAVNTSNIYDGTETEPEWVHLVFTWDGLAGVPGVSGDEEVKVYVNGTQNVSINNRNVLMLVDDGTWRIGNDRGTSGRTFNGLIDDLAVFDEVLDATTVSNIYNGGLAGTSVAAIVPEPTTLGLLGLVFGGLVMLRRRRR